MLQLMKELLVKRWRLQELIYLFFYLTGGASGWFGYKGSGITDPSDAGYGICAANGTLMKVITITTTQNVGLWNLNGTSKQYYAGYVMFWLKLSEN